MEKVSQILAEFRLNFGDDPKAIKLNSRQKCSKSIQLVDSLLTCSQEWNYYFNLTLSKATDKYSQSATNRSVFIAIIGFITKIIER